MTALGIDIGGSSVKTALLRGEAVIATGQSPRYSGPDARAIAAAIAAAIPSEARLSFPPPDVGVCAPGLYDPARRCITTSVNLPGLVGVDLRDLISQALARPVTGLSVRTDAHAAAVDYWTLHPGPDRVLALSLGTGVGACVLDDGRPVRLTGPSSGHLGQMDVSVEGEPVPLGPDGGRGSLEGYIGLPALIARYGPDLRGAFAEPAPAAPLRALARAIRITHAVYRPQRTVLLGGVGLLLAPSLEVLRALVSKELTSLARPGWELACGDHAHHAAAGAARLARAAG
ncbi:MAG: ROK family protein [Phycisphaerales bacterium]|nr:ROK family protein [Phycisphaerales bacterium]